MEQIAVFEKPLENRQKAKRNITLVKLQMVKESLPEYQVVCKSPADVAVVAAKFLEGADREYFIALFLDTKNKLTGINVVSVGSLNASLVHPREVFKGAILANAAALIVVHNHPSGSPEPSGEDKKIMQRLTEAGELIGIPLLDSLVLGDSGSFTSFKERGLI